MPVLGMVPILTRRWGGEGEEGAGQTVWVQEDRGDREEGLLGWGTLTCCRCDKSASQRWEGFPNWSGEALQRSERLVMKSQRAGEGCPQG